jgi:hypothetical protein
MGCLKQFFIFPERAIEFVRVDNRRKIDNAARDAVQADIAEAFRAAFLSIAAFTTLGFFLAVAIPLRRI